MSAAANGCCRVRLWIWEGKWVEIPGLAEKQARWAWRCTEGAWVGSRVGIEKTKNEMAGVG